MTENVMTRAQALAQGLTSYLPVTACKNGHLSRRTAKTAKCLECRRAEYKADPLPHLERSKTYFLENRETVRVKRKKSYLANRDAALAEAKAYRLANLHKVRERDLRAYHENGGLSKLQAWRAANRDKVRQYDRAQRERDPAATRAKYQRWYETEAGKAKALETAHRRRSRFLSATGTHTAQDLKALLLRQGHRCAYCRADLRKTGKHLDHIEPLHRGGSNDIGNLQWTCPPCNLSKGAQDPVEFAQKLGRLI